MIQVFCNYDYWTLYFAVQGYDYYKFTALTPVKYTKPTYYKDYII